MRDQSSMRLAQQGDVDGSPALCDVSITELVAQNRLADPWTSDDHVHTSPKEPTSENDVQSGNAGQESRGYGCLRKVLDHVRRSSAFDKNDASGA